MTDYEEMPKDPHLTATAARLGGPAVEKGPSRLERITKRLDNLTGFSSPLLAELDRIMVKLEGHMPAEDAAERPETPQPTTEFEKIELCLAHVEEGHERIAQKVHKLGQLL